MQSSFTQAADLLLQSALGHSRIIVTGIGKSGIIARKIAATLRSTGTAAHFLHPAEAIHGDLGMLSRGDTVLALSSSGETEELLRLLPLLKRLADKLITISGCSTSTLVQASDVFLDSSVSTEACPHPNLAPTASTTVMLSPSATAPRPRRSQPSSRMEGRKTSPSFIPEAVSAVVSPASTTSCTPGEALPQVAPTTPMPQVIYEMSRKKLGMTTVVDNGKLLGMISDGDLRRLLERDGSHALDRTAAEIMNPTPLTIDPTAFASSALALMEEKKITSLIVTGPDNQAQGVVHPPRSPGHSNSSKNLAPRYSVRQRLQRLNARGSSRRNIRRDQRDSTKEQTYAREDHAGFVGVVPKSSDSIHLLVAKEPSVPSATHGESKSQRPCENPSLHKPGVRSPPPPQRHPYANFFSALIHRIRNQRVKSQAMRAIVRSPANPDSRIARKRRGEHLFVH